MAIFRGIKRSVSKTASTFWGRGKKTKHQHKAPINSFGDCISYLNTTFRHREDRIFGWIHYDDIKYLEDVHKALLSPKIIPNKNITSYYGELYGVLKHYMDAVNAEEVKMFLQSKPELKKLVDEQLQAIKKLKPVLQPLPTDEINRLFVIEISALRLLVAPEFTDELWKTLPKPIEPSKKEYQGKSIKFDKKYDGADLPLDTVIDMLIADLTGLLQSSDPEILMLRLAKLAAMRELNIKNRNVDLVTFKISKDSNDFKESKTENDIFNAIHAAVERLCEKTETRTAGKTSQYLNNDKMQEIHKTTKNRIYKHQYAARKTSPSKLAIWHKEDNRTVIDISMETDPDKKVNKVKLTVPGTESEEYFTQAMIVDQLRECSKVLGAVSVTISSKNETTKAVNLENILKGAFNALHANLVPKLDAETWQAIRIHLSTAESFNKSSKSEPDIYARSYNSKEFAEFLLDIEPGQTKKTSYEDVYKKFTQLLINDLKYHRAHTNNRPITKGM